MKKADPARSRRWVFLASLFALLAARACLYRWIGPAANWTPHVQPGVIDVNLPFRSDDLFRMFLFSAITFAQVLGFFYLSLLLLSLTNGGVPDDEPIQKLVRLHLGRMERWPKTIRLLLPLLVTMVFWLALRPLLLRFNMVLRLRNQAQMVEEAAVIGLGVYLLWKYLMVAVLTLHLLNSYVYLGDHPLWNFIHTTARNLLAPLKLLPLRLRRLNFAPPVGIILVWVSAYYAARGLTPLFQRLPL